MGRVNETVQTVNSAVRTVLMVVALAGAALVGWKGYSFYNEPQKKLAEQAERLDEANENLAAVRVELEARKKEVAELTADVARKTARIDKLETSVRLLKLRHRIARLRVVDQQPQEDSDRLLTTIEFVEVNSEGAPIDDRQRVFEIEGDLVYVDCQVAKFEDKYVEQADLDRATAICLINRIFGEHQEPHEGYAIDPKGTSPTSYARGGQMSDFEKKIWQDFWTLANDPARAKELGIRAAHNIAPSIQVENGALYELELRSTGEFTLRRIDQASEESATPPETS